MLSYKAHAVFLNRMDTGRKLAGKISKYYGRGAVVFGVPRGGVPVSSGSAYDLNKPMVDELVSVVVDRTYPFAVAGFYRFWSDMTDAEVIACIDG